MVSKDTIVPFKPRHPRARLIRCHVCSETNWHFYNDHTVICAECGEISPDYEVTLIETT